MNQDAKGTLFTLRIIIGFLALGVFMFLGISTYLQTSGSIEQIEDPTMVVILLSVLGSMALGSATAIVFVRKVLVTRAANSTPDLEMRNDSEEPLVRPFQTLALVTAALTEGPGLFAVVIHLLTGSTIAFAAALISAGFLLTQLNLEPRLQKFVAEVTGRPF